MNKLIVKIITIVFCFSISVCLSSCDNQQENSNIEESYLEGVEQGEQDMFIDLFHASSDLDLFHCGDSWETDHFSLSITTKRKTEVSYRENAPYIDIDLTLNGITIEECYEGDEMVFNIYSYKEGHYDRILGDDNYFDYFLLQHMDGNNGRADVGIYEDTECLAVIIVIDGCVYTASYFL